MNSLGLNFEWKNSGSRSLRLAQDGYSFYLPSTTALPGRTALLPSQVALQPVNQTTQPCLPSSSSMGHFIPAHCDFSPGQYLTQAWPIAIFPCGFPLNVGRNRIFTFSRIMSAPNSQKPSCCHTRGIRQKLKGEDHPLGNWIQLFPNPPTLWTSLEPKPINPFSCSSVFESAFSHAPS